MCSSFDSTHSIDFILPQFHNCHYDDVCFPNKKVFSYMCFAVQTYATMFKFFTLGAFTIYAQLSIAILTQAISKTKNVCMNYFFNIFSKSQEIGGWRFKATTQKSA